MRKAILSKFIQVLLAALILNSVIFYIATSTLMLRTVRKDMLYTLETIDSILDYNDTTAEQIQKMEQITGKNRYRITLINYDGTVAADTGVDVDVSEMDNHLEREEVVTALKEGTGFATRYSSTLNENMLYVACQSHHGGPLLRLAVPFSGMREYIPMLLPAAWLSFMIAVLVSLSVTDRLVTSVTKPIRDMSNEMSKLRGENMEFHYNPCQYPEINVIGVTAENMSDRVHEYVEQIEKERGIRQEFFSNASHELKTPITSIQGYAELLENGIVTGEDQKKDFIRRIKKEAVNMTSLINDILMISRLETREYRVELSAVRISVVVQDVLDSIDPIAAELGVLINVDCPPITIMANAQQMREILINLVSNAVKYNHQGGQVWVKICQEDENLSISVKDNGSGISEEALTHIFERFYRVDKGRSRKQGGTGLGLSIVKHIVNYYGGEIKVHSRLNEGTEFQILLPVFRDETGM